MRNFNPSSTHPERAVQAWQILVGAAMDRRTLTYSGLAELMYGRKAAGVLDSILGHIAFYCLQHRLPMLNVIVVGKERGTPGHDIPISATQVAAERERVYTCDWFDIYPPSANELSDAYQAMQDRRVG